MTSGGGPVAVGPSHVYVTGLGIGSNNVQVINPETVAVESVIPTQPFNHSQSEFYILTGFGSLWIWGSGGTDCCNGRMFWRIDPATGRVRGRWLSPNDNGSYTGLQNQVAVGSGSVWLLRNGRLLRINPTTNGASGGLKVDASMVTAEGGAVWAVSRLGAVTEINPALYPALTATIWTHQFSKMLVDNVAAGDGQVWLMDGTNQRLTEINATSRHVSHTRLPIQTSGLLTIGHDAAWIGYPPGYGESQFADLQGDMFVSSEPLPADPHRDLTRRVYWARRGRRRDCRASSPPWSARRVSARSCSGTCAARRGSRGSTATTTSTAARHIP